jgi:hypothetical protein
MKNIKASVLQHQLKKWTEIDQRHKDNLPLIILVGL